MKIPKVCGNCNLYDVELKKCKRMNTHVGNTNSCFKWIPAMRFVRAGNVEFVEY